MRKEELFEALRPDHNSLDEYIQKMSDDGYYGDEPAIVALTESMPWKLVIFRTDSNGVLENPRSYGPATADFTMHLLLISELNHYVGLGSSLAYVEK